MQTMPQDAISAIKERYSCRAFSERMPGDELLQAIAEAGVASPSGMNRQAWRVIVVKDRRLIDDMEAEGFAAMAALPDKSLYERIMSRGGKLFYNAPCMIAIPIPPPDALGSELLDCGIVAQSVAIAAKSLGVDSLVCGLASFAFAGKRREEFKRRLGFPDGYEIGIAVLLGYAESEGGRPHRPDLSKISYVG